MIYCTIDDILQKVGVTAEEIEPTHLKRIEEESENEVDRLIKTTCDPKTNIITRDGNNKNCLYLTQLPLMSVKKVNISDTEISTDKMRFNPSGAVRLLTNAEMNYFITDIKPNISIKYIYGWLEELGQYETQEAVEKGDSWIELDSLKDLEVNKWIRITGMDGYDEWTKIEDIDKDENKIKCNLIYPHEKGSLILRGEVPDLIRKLTSVIGAIMGALFMVGSTYTFATSYSIPDHSVTKGVPHPHFSKVLDDLTKERNYLLTQIPEFPVFA
jgi:hypothetical protein